MSALLTHLTAVERLAARINDLPPGFAKALSEDLEYARFGAALPELPRFGGMGRGLETWFSRGKDPHFTVLMTNGAPVHFGLKAAELVSNGALVGVNAGLAFLAGYFTRLCVAKALDPLVDQLVLKRRKQGELVAAARARIEWTQSLFFMNDLHGSPLVGTSAIRAKLQIRKASSVKGVGRGLYELLRVSSLEALGEAPTNAEVDGWMRGLYAFSMVLASPLGRLKVDLRDKSLYRAEGVDVFAAVDAGLATTREVLAVLASLIRRNSWTARSRERVLALLPEGPTLDEPEDLGEHDIIASQG